MSKYSWVVSVWIGIAVLFASCTDTDDEGGAEMFATMTQELSGSSVTKVTVQVTGVGISSPISYNLVKSQGTWKGTIQAIPAGSGRTFQANARDASNTIVYAGTVTGVTITTGQTAVVAMRLQEVNPAPPFMNRVPAIDSLVASSNESVPSGDVGISVVAHDPDLTDTLTYQWSATAGSFSAPASAQTTWSAPNIEGPQTLTIRATDSKGSTAALSFSVVVRGRGNATVSTTFNTWPQVVSLVPSPTRIDVNETTALTLGAIDNDGDVLTYAWTTTCTGAFSNLMVASPQFTLSALAPAGSCALIVAVNDGRGGSTSGTISIQTGSGAQPNFAPLVDSAFQSDFVATGDDSLTFAVTAHDPDGTAVTAMWAANTGALATPTVTGPGASNVVWTAPVCFDPSVTPSISVTITDGTGVSTTYAFLVTAGAGSTCVVDAACAIPTGHNLLGIKVTPEAANVTGTGQTQLRAFGYYSDAPTVAVEITDSVTWSTSASGVVAVSAAGLASWTGNTLGTVALTASSGALSATANVRVWNTARLASLSALAIGGVPDHINSGSCHIATLTATFNGDPADTEDVSTTALWSSGGRYRVLPGNLFAANGSAGEGYYNFSASLVAGGVSTANLVGIWSPLFTATCEDPRSPGALWGIQLNPGATGLFVRQAIGFTAAGVFADGSVRDISTGTSYGTCQPTVVDVTPDGWAIGRSTGTGALIASKSGVVQRASISVNAAPTLGTLDALGVAPGASNVAVGSQPRFLALGSYSGAVGKFVDVSRQATWSSSDTGVMSVANGYGTAQQLGLASISAELSGRSSAINARVWAAARLASITSLAIGVPNGNISGGYCQQLSLVATFNNDPTDVMDLHDSAIWWVGNGTITNTGFWTSAPTNGYPQITASLGRGILAPAVTAVGVWGDGGTCP